MATEADGTVALKVQGFELFRRREVLAAEQRSVSAALLSVLQQVEAAEKEPPCPD